MNLCQNSGLRAENITHRDRWLGSSREWRCHLSALQVSLSCSRSACFWRQKEGQRNILADGRDTNVFVVTSASRGLPLSYLRGLFVCDCQRRGMSVCVSVTLRNIRITCALTSTAPCSLSLCSLRTPSFARRQSSVTSAFVVVRTHIHRGTQRDRQTHGKLTQ